MKKASKIAAVIFVEIILVCLVAYVSYAICVKVNMPYHNMFWPLPNAPWIPAP